MRNYHSIFLSFFLFFLLSHSSGGLRAEVAHPFRPELDSVPIVPSFPDDFLGKWAGDLHIFSSKGYAQTVPMQLHILPIDDTTYTYTIIYGEDLEAGKRDYLLRPVDINTNHWVVDEQDGIYLDSYYLGGVLQGPFSVMGTLLFSTLEKQGDQLVYAISSGKSDPVRDSGTTENEEEIKVLSYGVSNFQRAVLSKME